MVENLLKENCYAFSKTNSGIGDLKDLQIKITLSYKSHTINRAYCFLKQIDVEAKNTLLL